MFARIFLIVVAVLAAPTWLIGLAIPLTWLASKVALHILGPAAAAGLTLQWQLRLFGSSATLIFAASLFATILGAIAAHAFTRIGRRTAVWFGAAILIIPPVIYGYLWYLALAGYGVSLFGLPSPYGLGWPNLTNLAMASLAIGLWLWPISAVLLSVGWQWCGRPAWLLARLDATDLRAFLRAGLSAMRLYLMAAFGACALLGAQEYAAPALFSVQVWQTQWLTLAQAGVPLGKLGASCLPASVLLLLFLLPLACLWLAREQAEHVASGIGLVSIRAKVTAWISIWAVLALSTAMPAAGAMLALGQWPDFVWGRFKAELFNTAILTCSVATIAVAAASTTLPAIVRNGPVLKGRPMGGTGLGVLRGLVASLRRSFVIKMMLAAAIFAWLLPSALVAEAAREAQLWLGLSGRQVGMFVWVCVLAARLLPVAWLILMTSASALPAHLAEQAALDGVNVSEFALHILQPLVRSAAVAAWLVCMMLAAAETATASMLQQPGFEVLAVSLLNQMHYGRDTQVLAACLVAMAAAAVVATGVVAALGRFGKVAV